MMLAITFAAGTFVYGLAMFYLGHRWEVVR
jgi:hypothetical protein